MTALRTLLTHALGWPRAAAARAGRARWVEGFLAEDRLAIHFQPIVHADDPTRRYGHEALMRGRTRAGEPVPPVAILEPAREAGMLARLDLHARLAALRASRGLGAPRALFLNFSPQAVGEGRRHLDATIALADGLGLRREDLVFEITETERIEDAAAFRRVLDAYREAGFRLALDDIGSGYSSLHLIDALRPDFVKVDMSLVREVHADAFRASITAKLIELAAGLGLTTIAEGVEEVAEWRWLREHGADLVQGYLFGKPAPAPGQADDPGAPRATAARPAAAG